MATDPLCQEWCFATRHCVLQFSIDECIVNFGKYSVFFMFFSPSVSFPLSRKFQEFAFLHTSFYACYWIAPILSLPFKIELKSPNINHGSVHLLLRINKISYNSFLSFLLLKEYTYVFWKGNWRGTNFTSQVTCWAIMSMRFTE